MEFCISEHFCEAAVPHRCRWKKLLLFSVSLTLSFLFSNQPNFLAVKKKNTNLLLNSNDLQQRKKKERTVKCTFSSPPNHAIVAYTPFYKGCDVAFTKYPPATYPPKPPKIKESAFWSLFLFDKLVYLHPKKRVWFSTCFKCDIFKPEVWFFEIEVYYENAMT